LQGHGRTHVSERARQAVLFLLLLLLLPSDKHKRVLEPPNPLAHNEQPWPEAAWRNTGLSVPGVPSRCMTRRTLPVQDTGGTSCPSSRPGLSAAPSSSVSCTPGCRTMTRVY